MRAARRTWTIGGVGLIATGAIGMMGNAAPGLRALPWVVSLLLAASVLFLAIGLSREASVVDRRPLGITALAVVALWPFVSLILDPVFSQLAQGASGADREAAEAAQAVGTAFFSLDLTVSFAAALVAAVAIARSPTVPQPWRWAPMWALGVQLASAVIPQVLFVAVIGPTPSQDVLALVSLLAQLGFLARTLGLGILAVVLAARVRPESVEVLRSAEA